MKKAFFLSVFLLTLDALMGQKVIFLHHSTGSGVYYEGNVAQWIANYNTTNGTSYQIIERSYPDTPYPWANYPYDYWNLWINGQCDNADPDIECMTKITQNFDVIIFKHCFPGAEIQADNGSPSVSSEIKTLANYKLQYRALRTLMDTYPNRKFIVWTLVPLHRLATNADQASRAKQFSDWVKNDWLTEDGKAHPNIYIFDFFGLAAETNSTPVNGQVNCLKYDYELSHTSSDSHPNLLANQTIGPIFAQFIVNTIKDQNLGIESLIRYNPIKVYQNLASEEITLDLSGLGQVKVNVDIIDLRGNSLYHKFGSGQEPLLLNTGELQNGIYIIRTLTGTSYFHNKFLIYH